MRHAKRRTKLGKMPSHKKAMMRNMAKSLLKYQKIETTLRRAKEVRRLTEHLITIAKENTLAARRRAFAVLYDRTLVSKLFNEIAPLFKSRTSGYTRIIPAGFRRGDAASMAIIELTEKNIVVKAAKKKKAKEGEKAEDAKTEKSKAAAHEPKAHKDKAAKDESAAKGAEVEEVKPKAVHKAKAHIEEGKRAEKAKQEDKKIDDKKKFLKNLRGFFHRKSDM
ncbi:MAG: 50S ribosomal protein L17 [Candidatus Omnitrophota bacterium]|jgi:large subunit ribosomal protein L17